MFDVDEFDRELLAEGAKPVAVRHTWWVDDDKFDESDRECALCESGKARAVASGGRYVDWMEVLDVMNDLGVEVMCPFEGQVGFAHQIAAEFMGLA